MIPINKQIKQKNKGSVLIMAMILIVICSALAVSMATMSSANVQLASNQHHIDRALASAESGLEIQRYWLTPIMMPSSTPPADYFSTIVDAVQYDLDANSISNIVLHNDGSIDSVTLESFTGQSFSGQLSVDPINPTILQVASTGGNGQISRTIQVEFDIEPYEHPIFDYGLATKGPLNYTGNPTMLGFNSNWEADIYIESSSSLTALSVSGNTNFEGDIIIGNSAANVDFVGDVNIAGDHGQTAIDNHVTIGAEPVDFPIPDTDRFRPYATGDVIDASTDLGSYSNILVNNLIAANTNPSFPKSVTIQGILFIEAPNIVIFERNVALQGIIVADGDLENPGTNRIDVLGNFASGPYPAGAEFDAIRAEVGSSIVAPGFAISFQGNFSTLEGVVAVSGVHFSGNVNAMIKGTIINYSETPMIIEGNAVMNFDRAGSTKVPAGFDTHRVLTYNPSSYEELAL
jgi:flagellar basal body-associated protein FliL